MALKTQQPGAIKFWTPLRVVSTLIVLALIAAFGVSSCNSNDPPPRAVKTAEAVTPVLPPAVLNADLKSTNGQPLRLANYSGKVLLVNLWATWCGPCNSETPELVKLHKEFQDRGLEMVGLSTEDPIASAAKVQDFVRRYNVDYHIGWSPREVTIALFQMTGRSSIPQSFIITRDGRIKKQFVGFHPIQTPPQLRQAIEEALSDNG
jgi:peroxiredoxin